MLDVALVASLFRDLARLTPLTAGGQKWVYAAKHASDGDVVLKLIPPGGDQERIDREVLAVQTIQSPRVPRILGTGTVDTALGRCLWIREPRIAGKSVGQLLAASQTLPRVEVVHLAEHVLEALERAHAAKIVHRDIKPDNVMRDNAGNYWLLDFGIARHLDLNSVTATRDAYGPATWGYAPIEQLRNRKPSIDARSDLFALGVTMYQCLSGKQPFRDGARDPLEVMHRVESMTLPPLTIAGDAGGRLSEYVATLTRTRADHRPTNAVDALAWLREFANP